MDSIPTFRRTRWRRRPLSRHAPTTTEEPLRDLRALLWCSIDNDDSRDLDQLSVAESLPNGDVKVLVAIADVDAAVPKASAIDRHAAVNTTSVYTAAVIFPMLPEKLSTDLTSLIAGEDRLAIVIEIVVAKDGTVTTSDLYGGRVRNKAKLAYNSVGAWLEQRGPLPAAAAAVAGMDAQLVLQDQVAQALSALRHEHGALDFETIELRPTFDGDAVTGLEHDTPNRAKSLIENLMIAANGAGARFLASRGFPSIRRVVKAPERWDRIVDLAKQTGDQLPSSPDSQALEAFLTKRRAADPDRFPDLSLAVIKMLGPGEYCVEAPGGESPGHFGLAVKDYTHSTAPNRRYPDLLTQRLVKAALAGHPVPYALAELGRLADALHAAGRRGEQGRAAGQEIGRRARRGVADRSAVRCDRDRRVAERHVRAYDDAADRRQARAGRAGARRRRSARGDARSRRRGEGLHRLRARVNEHRCSCFFTKARRARGSTSSP